jgi:hypothetical protein
MTRVREIPYNYTSFSDREIVLRLLGEEAWQLVSELRAERRTGRSARMLYEVLGEMWAIQRNPYLEDELLGRPKRRGELLAGMRRRLAGIESRRGGSEKVARLLELTRQAVARFEAEFAESRALRAKAMRRLSRKVVNELMGGGVPKTDRCCGESGTLAMTRPDVSTQVRFSKEESLKKGMAALAADGAPVKVLTSCPSCVQGLARFTDDTGAEADYIVVELARRLLGEDWLPQFVKRANAGGIERVLL